MRRRPNARYVLFALVIPLLAQQPAVGAPGNRPFLHGLFTNAMMLQRDVKCPIWGWTEPGVEVTVKVNGQSVSAKADHKGKWLVKIGPFPVGEPTTLTITGPQTVTLTDVIFGDIWLCSGQSNMQQGVKSVDQWWKEYGSANLLNMRLYAVRFDAQCAPPATVNGSWCHCTPDALISDTPISGGFSAVAYFFGRALHRETKVPIGLIESCQGATDIAAWSTLPSLRRILGDAKLDSFAVYEKAVEEGWQQIDPAYAATKAWSNEAFDASAWKTISLPGDWRKEALPGFVGVVWMRKELELPAEWAGKDLLVNLGPLDEQDTFWFNGAFVGAYPDRNVPRIYRVPGKYVRKSKNSLALRVLGDRGIVGTSAQMTALTMDGDPASAISLAGPWRYSASTPRNQIRGRQVVSFGTPSACFQAMIAPLAPFAIKGVIWYQGEGDVGRVGTYEVKLKSMIADWRTLFEVGDFPFYIVQLANYGGPSDEPRDSSWASIREAQANVSQTVPNTGLAVAIDRGEIFNIHPPNKLDVGERLARVALAKTYGKPVAYEGPRYKSMTLEGNALRVTFDHAQGLMSRGSGPSGFAIAGADGKFVWAQAYLDGAAVMVSSPKVPQPAKVRYGWLDNPMCNLYNDAGLPAVPFRADLR